MSNVIGSNIAIIQDSAVLLTLRTDFEVWCLPGGHIDPGESFAECAVREAKEETGLDVRLTRLVGTYTRPAWLNGLYHIHLFCAEVTGGESLAQPEEVLEIRYFPVSELPEAMLLGHRQRVMDTLNGLNGAVRMEKAEWAFPGLEWREMVALYEQSGLSRAEFYRQYFLKPGADESILEVPGYPL